jgi:hypothetical protein
MTNSSKVIRRVVRAMPPLAAAAIAGCRSDSQLPGAPSTIAVVSGGDQVATVGTSVAVAPAVQVRDANGAPVVGVTVRFSLADGSGTIFGDSAATDANGRAAVGEWILGTAPGLDSLLVQTVSPSLSTTVTATASAGSAVSVRSSSQEGYLAQIGSEVTPPPAVLVVDSYGNPVAGSAVTFTVTQGGGSVTGGSATSDASGVATVGSWTLGTTAGTNSLRARISGGASVTFTAQAVTAAPLLSATTPTDQSGYLSFPVTVVPRVLVSDASGQPLQGVPVTFAITSGDGTVAGGTAISGSDGIAAPGDWRLGQTASTVTATAALGSIPVTFAASGVAAPFLIDVRFLTTVTPDVRDAFVAAARRWMGIITAHLQPVLVALPAGACGVPHPAINETVTDVVIYADVAPIDGVGNILGSSGPCATRSGSDLPATGTMQFDSADLQFLVTTNQLIPTITHEMAHVLGFGTIWADRGVISGAGSSDPIFTGTQALAMWPAFGAALNYMGRPIPVENTGGSGTRDSHWRETVFQDELMTGFIAPQGVPMPLSKITIASMADLGYQVDYSKADLFVGNLLAQGSGGGKSFLLNEQLSRPMFKVSPIGTSKIRQ